MTAAVEPRDRWYPVARSEELVPRHVVHAQLLGQELALWRDDAGRPNAWENRCPHRGVRLSIGTNDGTELRCRYHGWRFASGTGQCTFIPAHPAQKPAQVLRATIFPVTEGHGFVWVALSEMSAPSLDSRLQGRALTTLRSLFVEAPVGAVATALAAANLDFTQIHWLQPVDDSCTVIHSAMVDVAPEMDRLTLLRTEHAKLAAVRDAAEAKVRADLSKAPSS